MDYPISRREFLKTSGIVAGSLAIGSNFSGCASSLSAEFDSDATGPVSYPKLQGHKIQSPEHYGLEGCYTGIWFGNGPLVHQPKSTIEDYVKKVGKKPTFVFIPHRPIPIYYSGTGIDSVIYEGNRSFKLIQKIGDMGIIPFITYDMRLGQSNESGHNDVIAGKLDDEITVTAQWMKRYGEEFGGFFIRTMREMNLSMAWPWAGDVRKFKQTWQYIWTIFENEGANQYATWVFNPYVGHRGDSIAHYYYPEDQFVDWIGFNGYNFDGQRLLSNRMGFELMFSYPSGYYYKNHPKKPQLICETGMDNLNYKPEWVKNNFDFMRNSMTLINGVAIWSEKWSHKRILYFDSRIDSSPEALAAYREAVSDPYFIGAIKDRL